MTANLPHRTVSTLCMGAAMLTSAILPSSSAAQARAASSSEWQVPMTAFGQPDLQGNWTNATLTPLSRRAGQPAVLSPEQVAQIESGAAEAVNEAINEPSDPDRPLPPGGDNPVCIDSGTTCYNEVYRDPGDRVAVINGEARSSILTRPADGRVPALTPAAQSILAEMRAFSSQFGQFDHPEVRPLAERCIVSFGSNAGPPMLPNYWYNNNYTIVQSPDAIMIMTEMVHDVRIIRLGEPKPLPEDMQPYFGDSWGHWEGNTLVVETTNINPENAFQGVPFSAQGKVVERFTRTDDATIEYGFTIDDPERYAEPWGGELPFRRLDDLVYEYSCHEGNYALEGVLRGARFDENSETRR
ncbi:MAG: hypothetical protein OEO79_04070 [Gemmatimonadota bacterium]|nr:hypothetical protein [Gemmatimonadota bacterium]